MQYSTFDYTQILMHVKSSVCIQSLSRDILLLLQVVLLQAQSLEVSASGSACLQDCGPGYQCVSGKCERKICNINCNNQPDELVCGSNGNTFKNRCEIDKKNCESGTTITVEYTGACKC